MTSTIKTTFERRIFPPVRTKNKSVSQDYHILPIDGTIGPMCRNPRKYYIESKFAN